MVRPGLQLAPRLLFGSITLAALVGVTGCASNQDVSVNRPLTTTPASTAEPSQATKSAARPKPAEPTAEPPAPSAPGSAVRPPDPTAPSSVRPVGRAGATKGPRIAARATDFDSQLRWADGVELRLVARQGETGGVGPGSMVGAPKSTFTLTLTNGTDTDFDVSGAVLTTTYGTKSKRLAQPVYDESARDFSGKVRPAASTTAVYNFSVPTEELSEVTLTIDLDAKHAPASFVGSLR